MTNNCPDTVYGLHSRTEANGKCRYCGRKIERAIPKPDSFGHEGYDDTELGVAYRRYYDPDYGIHPFDD